MAITSNELSLSSSASSPLWDVFLSFYGKDTRRNFVANLYFALDQAGISTFRDDPALAKGQEISSGLVSAIRDTNMFVVVISENYARSSYCLDELVEILSSKKTRNQVVPVFYYVDPSDLRLHKGSFGEALGYHKRCNYSVDVIDKWKAALAEIAELSGYHLKQDAEKNESDTVQEIVEHLASQVSSKLLHLEEYLVRIDYAVEEIYQKLRMESNDVRAIGICGMGGIGKTTIAKAFYNKYINRFDIGCFIEDIKQYSQGGRNLLLLLQQLLSELLRRKNYKVSDVNSGMRQLQHILHSKKSLIIMDDLNQTSHLELLARLCKMVSAGSRIAITTRDVNQLNQLKVDISQVDIYMVRKLGEKDSLKLFSYHAFRKTVPPDNFRELSISFVTYCGGLPLALKVLGSSLRGKTQASFWRAKLEKVVKIPENEITIILRLSYEELADETEKEIFLDIVFFFVGKDKDEAVHIFTSCDFFPDVGIPILMDKCLLTIDEDNKFQMHNLIQDMGREVLREEFKHGKGRRLYLCHENQYQALKISERTNKIEGVILNMTTWQERELSAKIFERMPNLRLLEIIEAHHIQGNFVNSFHELRCIHWHYCSWTQFPCTFRPQKLVSLDMSFSEFKILWKDTMPLQSLKIINLSYSKKLKKTPDFRDMKMIEELRFRGCESLEKVHPSIGHLCYLTTLDLGGCKILKELPELIGELTKLGHLELNGCVNLKRLPEHIIQLTNLSILNLGKCKDLKWLPEQLGDMKGLKMLDASFTAIGQLPDSIGQLKALCSLNLYGCYKLRKLPEQFGNMEVLEKFDARDSGIEELPDSIGRLINLALIILSGCKNLTSLPDSICKLKLLKELHLRFCSKLARLPDQLGKMHSLKTIDASDTSIQELPNSMGQLSRIKNLYFDSCKKLKDVPTSIWNLTSLVELSLPFKDNMFTSNMPVTVNNMKKLKDIRLKCNIRFWLPTILSFSSLRLLHLSDDGKSLSSSSSSSSTKWFSLSKLSNLQILTLDNWGSSFPELPLNLTELYLFNHETLKELPDLSNLEHLERLSIQNCISLQLLPPIPLNLESLYVDECTNLKDVPDLSILKKLICLSFVKCSSLQSVNLKQSQLQERSQNLSFSADLPNKEIAEWFDYKSSGRTISFNIPSSSVLEDDLLGITLWVVFKYKNPKSSGHLQAVITNKTEGIKRNYRTDVNPRTVGEEVHSHVECISRSNVSIKGGDRVEVTIQKSMYSYYDGEEEEMVGGEVKVEKCGAHVILKKHPQLHDKVS